MGKFVPYFVNHGFDRAIAQHKEPSFDDTYNREIETLLEGLATPPQFTGNAKEKLDHQWWLPSMSVAVFQLQQAGVTPKNLAPLDPPLYPLHPAEAAPLQTLPPAPEETKMKVEAPLGILRSSPPILQQKPTHLQSINFLFIWTIYFSVISEQFTISYMFKQCPCWFLFI